MDLSQLLNGVKPEESRNYGVLPQGGYDVVIEKIEARSNDSGWKALSFQYRVKGEKFNNAVVFDQITIAHPTSEKAPEFGKARLARIAQLCGTSNTEKMIGKALNVYIGIKNETFNGESKDKNVVFSYSEVKESIDTTMNTNTKFNTDDIPF